VAGIAAGSGSPGGVAPDAKIAVVRSDTFTRLGDAVLYLIDLAEDMDVPLVINASVGGQYGPHDGRTPLESYLGSVLGEGRLMVAAAGNDGNDRIHVGADLDAEPVRIAVDGVPYGKPVEVVVDLWCHRSEQVLLGIELWDGDSLVASTPLAAPDSELLDGALAAAGKKVIDFSYGVELDDTHHLVHRSIVIDGADGELPVGGRLALRLSGDGHVDGWVSQSDYRYGGRLCHS
jgi:hypothetical protein